MGSLSNTSTAAMPGRPRFSADTSALSSMSSAREVLTSRAVPGMAESAAIAACPLSKRCAVASGSAMAPVPSTGGLAQLLPMPASRAETQEPTSPTSGASMATLLSASVGEMSIWMNFWPPQSL